MSAQPEIEPTPSVPVALVPVPSTEEEITHASATLVERIQSLEVSDQKSADEMAALVRVAKQGRKTVTAFFREMKESAHASWKAICKRESECDGPFAEAEKEGSRRLDTYLAEEKRRREEEARRLEAEARKQAEADALAEAEALRASGASDEEALAILDAPVPAPVVVPEAPKVAGLTSSVRWSARVDSKAKLVAFVAKNPQYLHLLDANMPNLNRMAVSLKGEMRIDGVTAVPTHSFAGRK